MFRTLFNPDAGDSTTMESRRFIQCDVFSPVPTQGNALAVVVDGQGLSDDQMRLFAAWTNLAETTFLFPPDDPAADYRVRILTPSREMPFAGHPTHLDNGPVWQVLQLDSAENVLAVDSSRVRWPAYKYIGLIGAHSSGAECDYEVRMLAPSSGMSEDPITGSLNAAIAHWMRSEGRLPGPITVAQGTAIGRHGRVSIRPGKNSENIQIGGQVHILIQGTVSL